MLTKKEIEAFADFAADRWNDRANAIAYYPAAQADVKANGWRVTKRVRDILWSRLSEIQNGSEG
jgi:hypothetical protein